LLLLLQAPFLAEARVTYFDHANAQFAGEIGLLSAGLGREFSRYSLGGMYGIVPPEMSGGVQVETVTIRQTYRFYDWKRFHFHGGLNIFHVLGLQYQTSKYGEAPRSYYPIGSIRGLLNLGTSFMLDRAGKSSFYFESGMNDIWLVNWLSNGDEVNPFRHLSLGLGVKQRF
jgi:hypothetical protein